MVPIILAICLACAPPIAAGDFELRGCIKGEAGTPIDGGETHKAELLARLRGKLETRLVTAWIETDGRWAEESQPGADLREAAVRTRINRLELTAGQQIVVWGRTDEYNPTDLINPEDYREFLFLEKAERKLGLPMIRVRCDWAAVDADLVLAAPGRGHRYPDHDSPWEPEALAQARSWARESPLITLQPDHTAPLTLANLARALRLRWRNRLMEAGVMVYQGLDHFTHYSALVEGDSLRLIPGHAHIIAYGADWFIPAGDYGFRMEAAIINGRLLNSMDPGSFDQLQEKDQYMVVAGIDRTFMDDLYVNAQLLLSGFTSDVRDTAEPEQLRAVGTSITYSLLETDLVIGLEAVVDIGERGLYVTPSVSCRATGGVTLEAGCHLIAGDEASYWGRFTANDYCYFSATLHY
ncbi:hypothetical protein JW905_06405 [bacterium]|nr:hypothetical protein [candidate division CSSED10-310 bacterium]